MWSVAQACRCAPSRLLVTTRSGFNTSAVSRQLITPVRYNKLGVNNYKGLRLKELIKSNGIVARLCSSSPKPEKTSKVVGYWLLGCSGMVFTAVVLGMVTGYIVLIYSVYYVVRVVVNTSKGK
uniref:Transmembrane protein n=1 Tax=Pectinophora gossypiella TaxID=13191 RepID=A0A1E1WCR9_PECGO